MLKKEDIHPRRGYQTLFDRFSEYCMHQHVLIRDGVFTTVLINPRNFHTSHERIGGKYYTRWYALKSGVKAEKYRPERILVDAKANGGFLVGMCGLVCHMDDYEPTEDLYDLNSFKFSPTMRFSEIPMMSFFEATTQYNGFNSGRVNKYHVTPDNYLPSHLKVVRGGVYRNINFYEKEITQHHNPTSKFVYLHHMLNSSSFFDEGEYLCDMDSYEYVTEEEEQRYKKIILFLL